MQGKRLARAALGAILALGMTAVWATDHVLIMTISEYPRQPLLGVKHDAANALKLASKLGYSTRSATVLKDQQLTGEGMRQAFANLLNQVRQNDRVFVYFSGHGYSSAQDGTCVQGLVAQDLTLIPTTELSNQLDGIKSKVSDALVIFDSCHSGGNRDIAVTRSMTGNATAARARLRAKVWTPSSGERCEAPVNELAKSWRAPESPSVARSIVFPKSNFTFVAAANEREVALDDQEKGGLATLGLLQCANEGVPSASGLVTALDLAACAQQHVARGVQNINTLLSGTEYLPHQLAVYGNSSKIFDLRRLQSSAPSIPVATAAPAAAPAPGATDNADAVIASFNKFAANSNGNWGLGIEPTGYAVPVGQAVRVNYQTSQTGYVQVVYVGSDRKEIKRVWPAEGQTRMLASTQGQLPISLQITAPAGENTFLIVVSDTPLDLKDVLQGDSAPATPQTMQQFGCVLIRARNVVVTEDAPPPPQSGACNPGSTTGAQGTTANPGGVSGYAARLFSVRGL